MSEQNLAKSCKILEIPCQKCHEKRLQIPDLRIMCVNMLIHADGVNYREVEETAGLQHHYSVNNAPFKTFTPQHLDIEKIEREIK